MFIQYIAYCFFFAISLLHAVSLKTSIELLAHLERLHVTGQMLVLPCQQSLRTSRKLNHCETSETAQQVALIFLSDRSDLYKSGYIQTDTPATQRNKCKSDSLNIMTFFIIKDLQSFISLIWGLITLMYTM